MKWIRISLVVVLQIACVASALVMLKSRKLWIANVRQLYSEHKDYSDMEAPNYPEIGMAANWPTNFAVTTGDPGLPPLVLALLVLFTFMSVLQGSLRERTRVYAAAFLIVLFGFHFGMVLQQNYFLQSLHLKLVVDPDTLQTGYTTIHGIIVSLKGKHYSATVRDPNIIPILMIGCFLAGWIPLAQWRFAKVKRPRARDIVGTIAETP